jgi:hypothetical protein
VTAAFEIPIDMAVAVEGASATPPLAIRTATVGGGVRIEIEGVEGDGGVASLFDVSGRCIARECFSGADPTMVVRGLSSGVYFVRVTAPGQEARSRAVVAR